MAPAASLLQFSTSTSDNGHDDYPAESVYVFEDLQVTMVQFGLKLSRNVYQPWQDKYLDYDKLKKLLREKDQSADWTDRDEEAFVNELINVQLEKVHAFQSEKSQELRERTEECDKRCNDLKDADITSQEEGADDTKRSKMSDEERDKTLEEVYNELEKITRETKELEKYSRINYTGFLKAAKKHDRRRGSGYKITPMMELRLAALPFNQEDYSPLLYRLSGMYSFVRQAREGPPERGQSFSESQTGVDYSTSHKFWVHPDNILELKTMILRRLPLLVYNPQTSKVAEGNQKDPTITSIYFDNPSFSLYHDKVNRKPDASSLRLRWYGQLADKPEILLEKKTMKEGDDSEEIRFPIKEKYIQSFIRGEYKMEKTVQKIQERAGEESDRTKDFQKSVDDIQSFIHDNKLQPIVRAVYRRTAFEIPGDGRVRISLDTDLALIREDAIDTERPCRDPDDWHREDVDDAQMEWPFKNLRKGEVERFPFAVLEIKTKGKKQYEWVTDLMSTHLVKEAPRFSKFVHGVATLLEYYVDSLPFWLSQMENIKKDPVQAFEEEQKRKAKIAEDEFAVGSLLNAGRSPMNAGRSPSSKPKQSAAIISPVGSPKNDVATSQDQRKSSNKLPTSSLSRQYAIAPKEPTDVIEEDSDDDGPQGNRFQEPNSTLPSNLASLFPSFSTSKYARLQRSRQHPLPPGVQEPTYWLKDVGPVKVEAKVWLANQRTFIKWQHVSILLASLSLGLYNAAGQQNTVARALALAYTLVAVFAGIWGWFMYVHRSRLIEQRSGKDFDNVLGPVLVCLGLAVALALNFGFKYHAAMQERNISFIEVMGFRKGDWTEMPMRGDL